GRMGLVTGRAGKGPRGRPGAPEGRGPPPPTPRQLRPTSRPGLHLRRSRRRQLIRPRRRSRGPRRRTGEVIEGLDLATAEAWIRTVVRPSGPIILERERAWATIVRVPLAEDQAWFKACGS